MQYFHISWTKSYEPYFRWSKNLQSPIKRNLNLPKFILIGRTFKVVGRLEFWITLMEISHSCTKEVLHHSYHDLFLLFGSQELRIDHLGNLSQVYSHLLEIYQKCL